MGREGFNWGWDQEFDTTGWIEPALRLLRPGGSIIIWNDWKLLGQITACLTSHGAAVKDPVVWEKNNPVPRNINRRYVSDKEFAVWAVKPGGKWTFNRPEGAPYARSAFRFPVPRKRRHPTKKPTGLFRKLIEIHSDPGDWILDPFAGEGTTAIAAKLSGRNSTCFELDPSLHRWAVARGEGKEFPKK